MPHQRFHVHHSTRDSQVGPPRPKELLGLVMTEAQRVVRRTRAPLHPGELWASGYMGLLDACRRYEPGRAASFEPYARIRIRGAMLDQLRKADHIPRRGRAHLRTMEKAERRLSGANAHPPDVSALAGACGLSEQAVHQLRLLRARAAPAVDIHELEDRLPAQHQPVGEGNGEVMGQLHHALSKLPQRSQDILAQHYAAGATYRDIASGLGVTESRVCQLHAAALRQLRKAL